MTLGQRLKAARERAGYTQEQLGEACKWGEDAQSRISNYETDFREPTLADIAKMAEVLGTPPEEIAFASTGLSPDELQLVAAWRLAEREGKDAMRAVTKIAKRPRIRRRPNLKGVREPDNGTDS